MHFREAPVNAAVHAPVNVRPENLARAASRTEIAEDAAEGGWARTRHGQHVTNKIAHNFIEAASELYFSKSRIEVAGRVRYLIELRTNETTAEALEKISANTERELVPFVSAEKQNRALGIKPFVSSRSGNRFRVWRVPANKRGCYRYLRGEVRDVNGERHIVGSFRVHPFHVIFALVPFAVAAVVWSWGDRTMKTWIFIAMFCAFGLAMFASRPNPREEPEIVAFLRRLFPNARFDVLEGPTEETNRNESPRQV